MAGFCLGWVSRTNLISLIPQPYLSKVQGLIQTARCGGALHAGRRQSIPSHSIANCAGANRTVPSAGDGQGK